jgi:hypothetical protein
MLGAAYGTQIPDLNTGMPGPTPSCHATATRCHNRHPGAVSQQPDATCDIQVLNAPAVTRALRVHLGHAGCRDPA